MSAKRKTTAQHKVGKRDTKQSAPMKGTGPVARVWAIASKMPNAARKDVLAACKKAGINPATAATQYQRWRHWNDQPTKKAGAKKAPANEQLQSAA